MNSHKSVILPSANMAEFMQLNPQSPKGLGVTTAAIFLSGEMAGSGILALPHALLGTGWSGIILIVFFSINAAYIGTRLGLCWEILAEMGFEEFSQTHVRDPYPLIAEKAGAFKGYWIGRTLRHLASGNNKVLKAFFSHQIHPSVDFSFLYTYKSTTYAAVCLYADKNIE